MPALADLIPDFELLVDDLTGLDDRELKQRPLEPFPKVTLWLLRDGRRLDAFFAHLGAWAAELEHLVRDRRQADDVGLMMRYILRVASEDAFDAIRQRVARVVPAAEETMASAADRLIQEGRIAALRDTLARLLGARFGPLAPAVKERLDAASLEELDAWIDRVLTAARLNEVFETKH